jgi:Zn-dependent protease with chaperone function
MGFGREKRIVVYDNLLSYLSIDEVIAIITHEIGHYKFLRKCLLIVDTYNNDNLTDMWKKLLIQLIFLGNFIFLLTHVLYQQEFYAAFGFSRPNVCCCLKWRLRIHLVLSGKCWTRIIFLFVLFLCELDEIRYKHVESQVFDASAQ